MQVYAVTLYIDETAAVRELQGLGSIPRPAPNPDDLADALLNGQFRCVPRRNRCRLLRIFSAAMRCIERRNDAANNQWNGASMK